MRTDNRILLEVASKGKQGEGKRYNEVGWFTTPTAPIVVKKEEFEQFCKRGCKNFACSGGCPPFAPNFNVMKKQFRNGIVVWCRMPYQEYPDTFIGDEKYNNNYFYAASFAQAVLPPVTKHIYRESKPFFNQDYYLGESACKSCGNGKCVFIADGTIEEKRKRLCTRPKERVFSLESSGIDVDMLMRIGGYPLHWYGRGKKITDVAYTIKAIMFLYRGDIPDMDITAALIDILNKKKEYTAYRMSDLVGEPIIR